MALNPAGYVIVDLTADVKDPDATQIVSFRGSTVSGGAVTCANVAAPSDTGPNYTITQLARLTECATDTSVAIDQRVAAADHIKRLAKASTKLGTPRFITDKGDHVRVIVVDRAQAFSIDRKLSFLVRGRKPKVAFNEKAREAQFTSDLKALVQVVAGVLGQEVGGPQFEPEKMEPKAVNWAHGFSHRLRLTRATLSVTAEAGKDPTILQAPARMTEEAATQLVERWEALQGKPLACEGGVPKDQKLRSSPVVVLLCRAQDATAADLRIAAIEGLGVLGDPRSTSVLVEMSTKPDDNGRVAAAAIAALARLKAPAAPAAAPAAAAKAEDEASKPKADLLTGPAEHWFLSADVPMNDVKALTFDKDTNQVTFGDEPSTFYVGINFLIGDIKETKRTFVQNLVFKVMIKASRSPLDSVGAAMGLRGQYFTKWGLNLDVLTPFVGYTSTQEDDEESGAVTRRARRNAELRFGVSLNLDQAVKWVGGK